MVGSASILSPIRSTGNRTPALINYSDALAELGPTHSLPKHTKRSHNLARSTQLKRYGRYSLSQFGTVASAGGHRVPANAPFQRRNRCLHLLTVAGERAFEICLQSPRTLLFQLSRKATIGFTLAARRARM